MAAGHLPRRHPARPPGRGLDDVWLRTGYDRRPGAGAEIGRTARLPRHRGSPNSASSSSATPTTSARSPSERSSRGRPRPSPVRREVVSTGETVRLRLGFPTVQIVGDPFLVNGRQVIFRGMNRHETHPERGRVFDEEHARADLA